MFGLGAQELLLLLVVLAIAVIGLVVIASKKSSRSTNYVCYKNAPFVLKQLISKLNSVDSVAEI